MALRGMTVDLYESSARLGGQLTVGATPPGKEPLRWLLDGFDRRLQDAGVAVHLRTPANIDTIRGQHPDAVVLATGATTIRPTATEGYDLPDAVDCLDVLAGTAEVGHRVAVIGSGMTGLEVAEVLARRGCQVAIFEKEDRIAPDAQAANRATAVEMLMRYGVLMRTGHRLVEIRPRSAVFVTDGEEVEIPFDTVVLALGMRPRRVLCRELDSAGIPAATVGDAVRIGRIGDAVQAGFWAGLAV